MSQHPTRRAPNYTSAFLASFGTLIFIFLCMIFATVGFVWVAVAAYGLDRLFQRLKIKR